MAVINTALGNTHEAIDALYKAYDEHFGLLVSMKVTPFFDQLRHEPQFIDLKEKMGL